MARSLPVAVGLGCDMGSRNINVVLAGYLAGSQDYEGIVELLRKQGLSAYTVPLRWWEWLPTVGGRSIAPILNRLHYTIQSLQREFPHQKFNIIAHSAGGWLARIYLGDVPYYNQVWKGREVVEQIVCLGTPHTSLEPWTKKNLDFVNQNYPGAFYPEVNYVCVAGKSVFGERNWQNWIAYNSYKLTCGEGHTWGDGITPVVSAHLQGAQNLTLEGVNHSPRAGLWYGSPGIVAEWSNFLL
ncbi:MAG: esterase/lipase family protein [Pseudanabaenaceae cyanobacterium]